MDEFDTLDFSDAIDEGEFGVAPGDCYNLTWQKEKWEIRLNNKKVGEITAKDTQADISSQEFIFGILSFLRNQGLEKLEEYLKGLE